MYVCKYNVIVCMIVASQSAIKHALSSLNDICSVRLEYTYMKHIHIVITIVIGMLNKNTWGIYRCEANQKQHCKHAGMCDQKL